MKFLQNLTNLANDWMDRLSPSTQLREVTPQLREATPQLSEKVHAISRRKVVFRKGIDVRKGRHLKKQCKFCGQAFYTSYLAHHMAKRCPVGKTKSDLERTMARRTAEVIIEKKNHLYTSIFNIKPFIYLIHLYINS